MSDETPENDSFEVFVEMFLKWELTVQSFLVPLGSQLGKQNAIIYSVRLLCLELRSYVCDSQEHIVMVYSARVSEHVGLEGLTLQTEKRSKQEAVTGLEGPAHPLSSFLKGESLALGV